MHEVVESFLNVQRAAFQKKSLAVDLKLNYCEDVVSFNFLQFLGIGLEELECFGVKTNSIEEVIINSSSNLLLYLLDLIVFHQNAQCLCLHINYQFAVVLLLNVKNVGDTNVSQNDTFLII